MKNIKYKRDFITLFLLLFLLLVATIKVCAQENIVLRWDEKILQSIRNTQLPPPQASRALAIVHTCIYDSWSAYNPIATSVHSGSIHKRPQEEHLIQNQEKAISFAAYTALVDLFPTQKSLLDNFMRDLGYNPQDESSNTENPSSIGKQTCLAVLEFRHKDGSNQLGNLNPGAYSDYTGYKPINLPNGLIDPNRWLPLPVTPGFSWRRYQTSNNLEIQKFLTPHWGMVIPFALMSGDELRPPSPALYLSDEYTKQAKELIELSAKLDDKKKVIAEYWFDGPNSETPPGHWCLLAHAVSRRDNHTIDDDVKMFFALANALFDASIAVWECKRFYDYVRPITAIHFLFKDKKIKAWGGPGRGSRTIKGSDWQPYLVTPPHPEHVSGHSTFSAVAAEVLKLFTRSDDFGESYTVKPRSLKFEHGRPKRAIILHWDTFTDAAKEAGLSRRYGGIHFQNADIQGQILGRKISNLVWGKAQKYFNGTAEPGFTKNLLFYY